MKSEIMITGEIITVLLFFVLVTSYLRKRIPYEIFYFMHRLVFILFLLTAMHTYDDKERNGEKDRSQVYNWFTASLVYYVCGRAAMFINHRHKLPVVRASIAHDKGSNRVVSITVKRPPYFSFELGQCMYQLRLIKLRTYITYNFSSCLFFIYRCVLTH